MKIIHNKDQHYSILFNDKNGFFSRIEERGFSEPFWSKYGPELLDVSITNWCDKNCSFCYRSSNTEGTHMTLEDYLFLMEQIKNINVLQIALGGGNPNQHPHFIKILEITRKNNNIVPNYTTNGRGLSDDVLKASKEFCGAVAVSAYAPYKEMVQAIEKLTNYKIMTNIHFVLDAKSIDTAIDWLTNPPHFLEHINALIFLNFKPIGRASNKKLLLNTSTRLEEFFSLIQKEYTFRIGFDSCSVSGIVKNMKIDPRCIDGCDGARFSMYINENLDAFPCSFLSSDKDYGISIKEKPLLEIWQNNPGFIKFRNLLKQNDCEFCQEAIICKGGCPINKEINLCGLNS